MLLQVKVPTNYRGFVWIGGGSNHQEWHIKPTNYKHLGNFMLVDYSDEFLSVDDFLSWATQLPEGFEIALPTGFTA